MLFMRTRATMLAMAATTVLLPMLAGSGRVTATPAAANVPRFDHIIVIIMENTSISQIVANPDAPFLNELMTSHTVARNYFGVVHPSLPNYMAITGGDPFFSNNCFIQDGDCTTPAPSIADRIEASGLSWKGYMEDMPSPCYVGDFHHVVGTSPAYREKHNPFIHYANLLDDPSRCERIVPYDHIADDLAALPNFVWITPNMCNDMHDGCRPSLNRIRQGDDWLSVELPRIQNSPSCSGAETCLIVVTFDEGAAGLEPPEDQHVLTIFLKPGPQTPDSNAVYDHYSLLRTIEAVWGLEPLTDNDRAASVMADMFDSF
jgi:acid phosphatase